MNGKRLDVRYANKKPGARVVTYDPNGTKAQKWFLGPDMTIRSILNDFCLTSKGSLYTQRRLPTLSILL